MFSIKKILKDSYNFYLAKFVTIVGITAFVFFLAVLFNHIVDSVFEISSILGILLGILIGVIGIVIEIGYLKYLLKLTSGNTPILGDLIEHTNLFWKYIFGNILLGLTVIIGLVLAIVPGIYLALRFMFVPLILIDKEISIKEAFKRSTKLTSGVKWKLLGFSIIIVIIQALIGILQFSKGGEIVLAAGLVLIAPFVTISFIKVYRALQGLDS